MSVKRTRFPTVIGLFLMMHISCTRTAVVPPSKTSFKVPQMLPNPVGAVRTENPFPPKDPYRGVSQMAIQKYDTNITSCKTLGPCSCKTNTGKLVDLNPITAFVSLMGGPLDSSRPHIWFYWSPCKPFNLLNFFHDLGGGEFLSTSSHETCHLLGKAETAEFRVSEGQLQLTYHNETIHASLTLNLICNSFRNETVISFVSEKVPFNPILKLSSNFACF